ncbi:MAG: anhydro-N-acetylmuramic acid kinase [Planctomycetales bacterium]|nr:anhydro-N-acetylmuramic acid kinase [Planctomycetales bacterium]
MTDFAPIRVIGLMSGTSADGVDAALVETDGETEFSFLSSLTVPYDSDLRDHLINAAQFDCPVIELMQLERRLTEVHVAACSELVKQTGHSIQDVQLIGFHGHTIRHNAEQRLTWQLGDASLLAESTQCPVVHDFRRRDIAAGGQGAPLAPLFHRMLAKPLPRPTAILNIGGVANITWIGPSEEIMAADTGPGCGLLDTWVQHQFNVPFDRDGAFSKQGSPNEAVIRDALDLPFFRKPIPKSADRFEFDAIDVTHLDAADGAATLCAITVTGVTSVVRQLPQPPKAIWVTGGGSRNPTIVSMLQRELGDVRPIEGAGLRSESLEAECFAWLAVRRIRNLPTSLPQTTRCENPTCGGSVTGNPVT